MTGTVAVLGPGAVGGALAVRVASAGRRVVCVARPETARVIAQDGLTLQHAGEALTCRPESLERLEEPVDLLLVAVKAFALDDALGRIAPGAEESGVVLPLLNGLEHMGALHERFGARAAAGSIGRLEAYRSGPTTIVQSTRQPAVTAAADGLSERALAAALQLLEVDGVDVIRGESEAAVLWRKAVRLAPLAALTSATGRPVGELLVDTGQRSRLRAAIGEACEVAAADGVSVSPAEQWEMIEAMPATLTTSTARDVAAGRPSELDAVVGGVVRAGRRVGVATPTLAGLLVELEAA